MFFKKYITFHIFFIRSISIRKFMQYIIAVILSSDNYSSMKWLMTLKNNYNFFSTSNQGSLTVWDITSGVPVRVVRLGDRDDSVFIRHMMPVADTIVCDYGNQLRVVKLPVAEKMDWKGAYYLKSGIWR